MPVQYLSPEGMIPQTPYHHVAVGTGTRYVHVAGQVAHMPDGGPIPSDLAGQVGQALRNVRRGLQGAGAEFRDVVRLTVYVTEWEPSKMGGVHGGGGIRGSGSGVADADAAGVVDRGGAAF